MQTKAERRAEHNAIERARRESLNSKFQQLAHCLPNLQNDSRPSKSTIIERTLDFVKGAILKEERMQNQINELERVNRYLLSQLDSKQQHHQSTSAANTPSPSSAMSEDSLNLDDELIMIEKRKFKKDCNRLRQTKRKESPGLDFPPSVSSHPEAVNPVPHQSCNQSVPMVPKQKFQVNMPATAFYPSNYAIPNNNKMKEALYFQPQNQPMFQPLQYNSDNDDDEDNSMDMNQINNNNATFDLQPTSHNFQPMMPGPLSLNQCKFINYKT
jgi:hypothetical protein